MTRQIALYIHIAFILWLFFRDRKLRPMTSVALWVPLLWIMIIGSRAVSIWVGAEGPKVETVDDYLQGSPFDRNTNLVLIIAGIFILLKRHIQWGSLIKSNFWFFAFFVFCGISCFWSNYAVTAFKRYSKDIGNIIMALIIITETKPAQAIRAVLARYAYFAIIISVLFVKYMPELGRYYNRWTYQVVYCGIATEKNNLGQILFICGIFIVWDLIEIFTADDKPINKIDLLTRGILLSMTLWLLLDMAHSSTSILCFVLGTLIIISMRSAAVKRQVRNLGTWSLVLLFLMLFIYIVPGMMEIFVEILGRNATLTGRTDLWAELLAQPINPMIGTGFQSFWQTPEAASLGEKFYFIPNQAHNGYLEVYLQTGLIGLLLLVGAIIAAGSKLKKLILEGGSVVLLLFSFFVVSLVSNWTEASTNKPALVWFLLILALMYYPITPEIAYNNETVDINVDK